MAEFKAGLTQRRRDAKLGSILCALAAWRETQSGTSGVKAPCLHCSERNPQTRDAAAAVGAVLEGERATVVLGDLAAEDEADAGAGRLRREERHEKVLRVGDAGAIVLDGDLQRAGNPMPAV